jgi:hypothetical protein
MNNRIITLLLRQRGVWFTFAFLGSFALFFQEEIIKRFNLTHTGGLLLRAYSFAFIIVAISLVLLDYLKGDKSLKRDYEYDIQRKNIYLTEELRHQIIELQQALLINKNGAVNKPDNIVTLTEADKEKLFDIITKTVSVNINSEFLKSLDEKYSLKIVAEARYKELLQNFDQTRTRVMREIDSLSRRANLNLVIGSVTTIIAVGVLFSSVYSKDFSLNDTAKTLSYFIPRISTVIFIEIFSFFFLKLYRSNLNDVKYYQNEMTNIEFKVLSLKSALMTDDKETLKQIISELNKIERNFILQPGETTVDIETNKYQNRNDKSFTDNLKIMTDSISKLRGKD